MSWECTGHTMTWPWPGRPGNHVSIARARAVSLLHIIQTDCKAHPASYSTSTNVASFHVVKEAGHEPGCKYATMVYTNTLPLT